MTNEPADSETPVTSWPAPRVTIARASYRKVTSMLILCVRRGTVVVGDVEAHRKAYKEAQLYCATIGWWSIFGLIWTPLSLAQNSKTFKSVEAILGSGSSAAQWFKDPSGKFDERYWDGQKWTDQVRSAMSDTPPVV